MSQPHPVTQLYDAHPPGCDCATCEAERDPPSTLLDAAAYVSWRILAGFALGQLVIATWSAATGQPGPLVVFGGP